MTKKIYVLFEKQYFLKEYIIYNMMYTIYICFGHKIQVIDNLQI